MSFQAPYSITDMRRLQMAEAQMQQQQQQAMFEGISGALDSIVGGYMQREENKAKGRAFKDVFKVVSPTLGMSMEQLEGVAGGKLKTDLDWHRISQTMGPMMPSLINMQLGQQRMGVQRDQQALTAGAPIIRQQITNANTRAEEGDYFDATSLR
jgi:hypothetical protein